MDGIGERLKEERLRNGWSQKDLARESETNVDTISGIETGQHEPRPSTLRKLAKALSIEVRDLFEEPVPLGEAPREAGQLSPERRAELVQWWKTVRKGAIPLGEWSDEELAGAKQALERMKRGEPAVTGGIFEEESPEQAKAEAEAMRLLVEQEEHRRRAVSRR